MILLFLLIVFFILSNILSLLHPPGAVCPSLYASFWNDFLLPLLMVNSSNETKTLVLAAYTFVGQMNTKWHYAMTAMVLAVVPSIIIFIFLQKYIVDGVVAGAVKG